MIRGVIMKRIKKIIGIVLCITLFTTLVNIPNQYVYATQNKTYNYSKGYSIQGNGADDIMMVIYAKKHASIILKESYTMKKENVSL